MIELPAGINLGYDEKAPFFIAASVILTLFYFVITRAFWALPWERAGRFMPRGFKEKVPPWSFSSAGMQYAAVYIPGVAYQWYKLWTPEFPFMDMEQLHASPSEQHATDEAFFWFNVLILCNAFASMAKDGLLFPDAPDKLLALHHIGVMIVTPAFLFLPGVRGFLLAAICVPVAELGTSCFCAFVYSRRWVTYAIGMTISNGVLAPILYLWAVENWNNAPDEWVVGVSIICCTIVLFRQIIMVKEVAEELEYLSQKKRQASAKREN
eukprot:Hpha_TRINITY_DN15588_c0_g12::TRINITY_DN15588_c0_g12_i1::g.108768::m.108768